jgi:hypothetical protein
MNGCAQNAVMPVCMKSTNGSAAIKAYLGSRACRAAASTDHVSSLLAFPV